MFLHMFRIGCCFSLLVLGAGELVGPGRCGYLVHVFRFACCVACFVFSDRWTACVSHVVFDRFAWRFYVVDLTSSSWGMWLCSVAGCSRSAKIEATVIFRPGQFSLFFFSTHVGRCWQCPQLGRHCVSCTQESSGSVVVLLEVSFAVVVPMMVAAVVTQESSGSVENTLAGCLVVAAPKSHRALWCLQGQCSSCCTHVGRSCGHPRVIRLSGGYMGGMPCCCCTQESPCSVVFARSVSQLLYP